MRKVVLLLLTATLLFTMSCQEQTTAPTPIEAQRYDASILFQSNLTLDDTEVQEFLSYVWSTASHDEWDVISGVVNLSEGGTISGVPDSWPAGYEFSIIIPANCSAEYESNSEPAPQTLELQIHVPKYIDGTPLAPVYKLYPDLQFSKPVAVTFCYPPWLEQGSDYIKFCLDVDENNPDYYLFFDLEMLQSSEHGASFYTNHFSIWDFESENGGSGG